MIRFLQIVYRGLTVAQWLLIAAVVLMIAVGYYDTLMAPATGGTR